MDYRYCALMSLDICGVFDSLDWYIAAEIIYEKLLEVQLIKVISATD